MNEEQPWWRSAACEGISDPENLDGDTELPFSDQSDVIKSFKDDYCWKCPVARECLQDALDRRTVWGVWGRRDQNEIRAQICLDDMERPRPEPRRGFKCLWCSGKSITELTADKKWRTLQCADCGLRWTARIYNSARREKAVATDGKVLGNDVSAHDGQAQPN